MSSRTPVSCAVYKIMHFCHRHFITCAEKAIEMKGLDSMSIEREGTTHFAF